MQDVTATAFYNREGFPAGFKARAMCCPAAPGVQRGVRSLWRRPMFSVQNSSLLQRDCVNVLAAPDHAGGVGRAVGPRGPGQLAGRATDISVRRWGPWPPARSRSRSSRRGASPQHPLPPHLRRVPLLAVTVVPSTAACASLADGGAKPELLLVEVRAAGLQRLSPGGACCGSSFVHQHNGSAGRRLGPTWRTRRPVGSSEAGRWRTLSSVRARRWNAFFGCLFFGSWIPHSSAEAPRSPCSLLRVL